MNVISTEVGMEIAVTKVARTESRKTRITSTAKIRPRRPSWVSESIDCWMKGAWSKTMVKVAPGTADSSFGRRSRTCVDTSTVLAAGTFVTAIVSAVFPLTREMLVAGLGSSATVATSPSVVSVDDAAPGTVDSSGSALRSSTEVSLDPSCTERVLSPSVSEPAGTNAPFCAMAARMDCVLRPRLASSAASGVIVTR